MFPLVCSPPFWLPMVMKLVAPSRAGVPAVPKVMFVVEPPVAAVPSFTKIVAPEEETV